MMQLQGKSKDDPEALRTEIATLYFIKVNGNWYANSFYSSGMERSDMIEYSRDEVTGKLHVKLKE